MTKKRTSKSQKTKVTATRVPAPKLKMASVMSGGISEYCPPLPKYAIASINPFCKAAYGAKIPDEQMLPTVSSFSRGNITLTTDASGVYAGTFTFWPDQAYVVPSAQTATQLTWPAGKPYAGTGSAAQLDATMSSYRTVAWGVKVSVSTSYTATSGFLHVCYHNVRGSDSNWTFPDNMSNYQTQPYYRRIPLASLIENELLLPGLTTSTKAHAFRDGITTVFTDNIDSGWSAISIWIVGAPASTAVAIADYVYHLEGFPKLQAGGTYPVNSTGATPFSPGLLAAVKNAVPMILANTVTSGATNIQDTPAFWKTAVSVMKRGAALARGDLVGMLTG